jgi:uncharacterized small protein (DUF1192 family)
VAEFPHTYDNRWVSMGNHVERLCTRCALVESQSARCPAAMADEIARLRDLRARPLADEDALAALLPAHWSLAIAPDGVIAEISDQRATIDKLTSERDRLRAQIGRTDITRDAYEKLIAEDGAWLLSHPRTLEREHIMAVLQWSIGALYGKAADAAKESK